MTKLDLKDVIKLIRELKKSGTLSKKKRRRIKKIKKLLATTNSNIKSDSNPQSYGHSNVNQGTSNLNTLIASEQLSLLEKKKNEQPLLLENNDNVNNLQNNQNMHDFLLKQLYHKGNNQFNAINDAIGDIYNKIGYNDMDNIDVPTTYGTTSFIPEGQKMSQIDLTLNDIYPSSPKYNKNDDMMNSSSSSGNNSGKVTPKIQPTWSFDEKEDEPTIQLTHKSTILPPSMKSDIDKVVDENRNSMSSMLKNTFNVMNPMKKTPKDKTPIVDNTNQINEMFNDINSTIKKTPTSNSKMPPIIDDYDYSKTKQQINLMNYHDKIKNLRDSQGLSLNEARALYKKQKADEDKNKKQNKK